MLSTSSMTLSRVGSTYQWPIGPSMCSAWPRSTAWPSSLTAALAVRWTAHNTQWSTRRINPSPARPPGVGSAIQVPVEALDGVPSHALETCKMWSKTDGMAVLPGNSLSLVHLVQMTAHNPEIRKLVWERGP